ncbi:hypothetical protein N658DRAFT_178810 [Parathielavia hyrcaniae]|uniref:Uncharacterized protein n=1 Tax=Parathielavia hyrcaniae TaxID=113614 RepID=A0AAN6Q6G7_9PEZI|nr:hypothetical protein N658DRAFT_178810 [Parathielavia hyrcaniae]
MSSGPSSHSRSRNLKAIAAAERRRALVPASVSTSRDATDGQDSLTGPLQSCMPHAVNPQPSSIGPMTGLGPAHGASLQGENRGKSTAGTDGCNGAVRGRPWSGWKRHAASCTSRRAAMPCPDRRLICFLLLLPALAVSQINVHAQRVEIRVQSRSVWLGVSCRASVEAVSTGGYPKRKLWRGFSSALEETRPNPARVPGGVPVFSGRQLMWLQVAGNQWRPGPDLANKLNRHDQSCPPPDRLLSCRNRLKGLRRTVDLPSHGPESCSAVRTLASGPVRTVVNSLAKAVDVSFAGSLALIRLRPLRSHPTTPPRRILDLASPCLIVENLTRSHSLGSSANKSAERLIPNVPRPDEPCSLS